MPTPSAGGSGARIERRGAVALLWIDHPPVNVLSASVLEALRERLRELEADTSVRAIVLASAIEKAFAAGADLREMAPMSAAQAKVHGGRGQGLTRAIERIPIPVIAAVHGSCLGGGCEVALACDLVIASEDASFGQPEIKLGIIPGWGGTRRLPRRVGAARARDWILTGRTVSAREAEAAGWVSRVVPRAELLSSAIALAEELAQRPSLPLAAAKYALNGAIDPTLDAGLRYELALWVRLFGTPDQREGMNAFLERRPPQYRGRIEWEELSRGFPWAAQARRPERRGPSVHRRRGGREKS
ncbi:MAG: enoyl-CoA hydratase-related protein [Thermoplasmata archaeon]|nr:enoyl-CoA hydratase-related protein [Thermoplasmata archaeon]MCI4342454.1 enoyl-CoA hydratase-related protein [Thermoplasmata archaeon]